MEESSSGIFSMIFDIVGPLCMMFGGIVPFIPQYKDIKRLDNADGFSLYVCLVLLLANTLRILFWFGHPFELPLLIQSIIMILGMFVMIELCVKVKNRTAIIRGKERQFFDMETAYFWDWTDFLSYMECVATFTIIVGLATFMLLDVLWFVEAIGFLAVFTEAALGIPQFYRNFCNKSTEGMNKSMVMMWLSGDLFKTQYFITRSAPVQFSICGALQVLIDIAILVQIWAYSTNSSPIKSKVER